MKSRWKIVCVFLVLLLGVTGCGEKEPEPQKGEVQTEEVKEEENSQDIQKQEEQDTSEEMGQKNQQQKDITVYFANEDASGFETEEMELEQVSAENVWGLLVIKGVVPADTQVLNCKEQMVEGKKALQLDVSEKFSTYLNGQGSSGEYLTVGCICNTFLDAFDGETIRITVDGKKLETEHAEYPGYMSKYESK